MGKFYVTTSIAYVNAPPHVGYALELLQADALARYNFLLGKETYFLTGTDEHGAKIAKAAETEGKDKQKFVDEVAAKFQLLADMFNISNNDFIRTTDRQRHWPAVQKIWRKLEESGDLYRAKYKGLYCVGHEAFMKPSELKDGECVLHKQKPEVIEEENWFFKLGKYKKRIKEAIENQEMKILPEHRQKEVLNLLDDAEDVSFSRPSKDLKWGVPVPGDETSTVYVWCDALTNYISAIGYFDETEQFKKLWPADAHLIGKDILRFHAMIWPAMLLSAGLPLPKAIYVHGFINVDGQKMSKTIGNVIDPFALVEKYGIEPVRYFLLREIPSGEDGDFSYKKLEERYQSDLANGLGNLVQRVLTLIENSLLGEINYRENLEDKKVVELIKKTKESYEKNIDNFRLHEALGDVFSLVNFANGYVNQHKPWELVVPVPKLPFVETKSQKDKMGMLAKPASTSAAGRPDHFLEVITNLVFLLLNISFLIYPFMPETAEKILKSFGWSLEKGLDKLDRQKLVTKKEEVLFPRL
ncbi:MAG: methionine--tRNA ligase [Candidatus Yanofskybacteria bacterium]|nr:methionine--tRNA ligase [Candidatus Yanofskybacteria bacterium]